MVVTFVLFFGGGIPITSRGRDVQWNSAAEQLFQLVSY
jgi:hypothetical protein